ncbi:hypothetical protein QTP88_008185 [Uroleucon formosanum]
MSVGRLDNSNRDGLTVAQLGWRLPCVTAGHWFGSASRMVKAQFGDFSVSCNKILHPNIKKILHVIACLPVSVASAERSFSTLRRLKTWLRSNMGEECLVGLPLLNVHRHRTVEVDEVIDLFASSKKRNLDFVI